MGLRDTGRSVQSVLHADVPALGAEYRPGAGPLHGLSTGVPRGPVYVYRQSLSARTADMHRPGLPAGSAAGAVHVHGESVPRGTADADDPGVPAGSASGAVRVHR